MQIILNVLHQDIWTVLKQELKFYLINHYYVIKEVGFVTITVSGIFQIYTRSIGTLNAQLSYLRFLFYDFLNWIDRLNATDD